LQKQVTVIEQAVSFSKPTAQFSVTETIKYRNGACDSHL